MSCIKCPTRCKKALNVCIKGEGPANADIMFIGEAPGVDEDSTGRQFVGASGRFLRKHLFGGTGIDGTSVYMTTAVKCVSPNSKNPSVKEIRNCREYLVAEIKAVKPKVLVLMGNAALNSVGYTDKYGGVMQWRGNKLWSREFNCWVVPTYNPTALMVEKRMGVQFRFNQAISDFESALVYSMKPLPVVEPLPAVRYGHNKELATACVRDAWNALKGVPGATVAIDLETHLFDPRNEILGVALCHKQESGYKPMYVPWGNLTPEALGMLRDICSDEAITKVFHNSPFDIKFLHYHGVEVRGRVDDTMLMAHLLDENFSVGLKECTWKYLNFGGYDIALDMYKFEHKFTKGTSYKEIPDDVMAPYAGMDALATLKLSENFPKMLREQGLWPLYNSVIAQARRVFTQMEINGLKLDEEYAKKLYDRCEAAKAKTLEMVYKEVGREFNINSQKDLREVLIDRLKIKSNKKTKGGAVSVDRNVLKAALESPGTSEKARKVIGMLSRYKSLEKLQGTFITQALTHCWKDGCVHSSFNLAGPVTGRASNSNPCTHNIPKDRLIRQMYVSKHGVLVDADIKAAELRMIAIESGEPAFLDAFNNKVDIHTRTYNTVFGKPDDYVPSDVERRLAKTINFGLIYGITPVGLAPRLECSVEDAEMYMKQYFKNLPYISRHLKKTVKFAMLNGYVKSVFGRRRRLPDVFADDMKMVRRAQRQAMNAPIQAGAADFTYVGLIRVARALQEQGLRSEIVQSVHDCVVVDCYPEEVEAVKGIITKAFTDPVKGFTVTMEVDVGEGTRWGEHGDSNLETILLDLAC